MDEHDGDTTGELDLPGDPDDPKPSPADDDPGFDGWLDGDGPADAPDAPYAALTDDDDDAAAEIADWMAFTNATADDGTGSDDPEVVVDVTDAAVAGAAPADLDESDTPPGTRDDAAPPDSPVDAAPPDGAHDDTVEFYPDEDVDESDRAVRDDADEQPDEPPPGKGIGPSDREAGEVPPGNLVPDDQIVIDASANADPDDLLVLPIVPAAGETAPVTDAADADADAHAHGDDTGDVPIIGASGPSDEPRDGEPGADVFDIEELTENHYLQTATREHQDLAAAISAAESENTEQVALSAAIPGLDAGVVGFDDVVESHEDVASPPVEPPKSSDLVLRVGTGVALVVAFLLSLLWRPAIIVLALAAFVVAAGEFYSVLIHRHYKPLSIFGFLGILGAGLGTVVWGVVAIPIAFAAMITVILLFDAVSPRRQGAVSGFALTILVAVWIGGFGAFAFPIIAAEDYQALVLALVAMVALVDIAAYFVGRTIGRRPFAPVISPKKTIEGFVGGTLMALLAGAGVSFFLESIDLPAGLILGAVVAVFAPLGDLAVSVVKRSLAIKDMGSILPGHGGLLDRIDAIIAVVPAAWATFAWMGLL